MKSSILAILLFLTSWQCEIATASLLVDKAIVIFDAQTANKHDITVINDDPDAKLYVKVDAFEVQSPGTVDETLVPFDRTLVPEFIATPNKLVIQPGSKSLVWLMNLTPINDEERIYRINFLPIARPIELATPQPDDGVRPVLDIIIAYQVLAIVSPRNPVSIPRIVRHKTLVTVSNTGNANFLLTRGRQCNPTNATECAELPHKRIYPGNTWELNLPYDAPFSYDIQTHAGNSPSFFQ